MGKKEGVLGKTYEPGKPSQPSDWRKKLNSREEILKFLRTAERYWYSRDWFGSEKRKTPA